MNKVKFFVLLPFLEIKGLIEQAIIFWPNGIFGFKLRTYLYNRKLKAVGSNMVLHFGVAIDQPQLVEIGNNFLVGNNVRITAGNCNGIFIGDNVAISNCAYLRSAIHKFDNIEISILDQGYNSASINYNETIFSIVIENDVWIGAGAIILSGAHIGKGSMISAGALVTNIIPPYSIVVGNPGRVIGNRIKKNNNEKI